MATVGWDYGNNVPPELWHLLQGSSAKGQRQSPIEISHAGSEQGAPPLPEFSGYQDVSLDEFLFTSSHLEIEAPHKNPGTIEYNSLTYEFRNFHLHTPSEHTFEGKRLEMEIHVVHKWRDGQPDEKILVIGVCVEVGAENLELEKLIGLLTNVRYKPLAGIEAGLPATKINPRSLYPASKEYYFYEGSLTTPPCSENVTFFLFKKAITASCCQLEKFAKFAPGGNNRPLQPRNGRKVYRSGS